MSTILCFSVNMGCCVYINKKKKKMNWLHWFHYHRGGKNLPPSQALTETTLQTWDGVCCGVDLSRHITPSYPQSYVSQISRKSEACAVALLIAVIVLSTDIVINLKYLRTVE